MILDRVARGMQNFRLYYFARSPGVMAFREELSRGASVADILGQDSSANEPVASFGLALRQL